MAPSISRPVAVGQKPRERLPAYGIQRDIALQQQGIKRPWDRTWKVQKPSQRPIVPRVEPPSPSPSFRRVPLLHKRNHTAKAVAPISNRVDTSQLLRLQTTKGPRAPLFPEGSLPVPRVESKKRKRDLSDEGLDFHLPVPGEWPLQAGRERQYTAAEAVLLPLWDQRSWRAPHFLEATREEQRAFTNAVCNRTWKFAGRPATIAGLRAAETLSQIRTNAGLASAIVAARVDDGFRYSVKYGEQQIRSGKRRCVETWSAARSPLARYLRRVHLLGPESHSPAIRRALLEVEPFVLAPSTFPTASPPPSPSPPRTPRPSEELVNCATYTVGNWAEKHRSPQDLHGSTNRQGEGEADEPRQPLSPSAQLRGELDIYIRQHEGAHTVDRDPRARLSAEKVSEWFGRQSSGEQDLPDIEQETAPDAGQQTFADSEHHTEHESERQTAPGVESRAVHDIEPPGSHISEETGLVQPETPKGPKEEAPQHTGGSKKEPSVRPEEPLDLPPTYLRTPTSHFKMAEPVPSSTESLSKLVDRRRRRTGRASISPGDIFPRNASTRETAKDSPASMDRVLSRRQFNPLRRVISDRNMAIPKTPFKEYPSRASSSNLGVSLRLTDSPSGRAAPAQTTGDVDPLFSRYKSLENRVGLHPGSVPGSVLHNSRREEDKGEVELGLTTSDRVAPSPSVGGRDGSPGKGDSNYRKPFVSSYHDDSSDELSSLSSILPYKFKGMQIDEMPTNTRRSTRLQDKEAQRKLALAKKRKEKLAAEESFKKAQEEIQKLNAPKGTAILPELSEKWAEKLVSEMDAAASPNTQLATSLTNTALNRHAFGTCVPRTGDSVSGWLNDEIIFAYLEHIVAYAKGETKNNPRPKQAKDEVPLYASFNSQFWSNIESRGPASVARWPNRMGLKGDRLLKPELVFIPINSGSHWTLMALYPRQRKAVYYDSMGNRGGQKERTLRGFLSNHLKESYKAEEWTFTVAESPQQNNGSDCGVFAITNARMLALGWEPMSSYGHQDMPTQRQRVLCELMNGGFHGDFAPADALAKPLKRMAESKARKETLEAEIAKLK